MFIRIKDKLKNKMFFINIMISNFDISKNNLINEISNQLADIDIDLQNNRKNYNLINVNKLLVKSKLLNKLKNKIENNQELYVKKIQQIGAADSLGINKYKTDEDILTGNDGILVIFDLQSVIKYKPNGNKFILENELIYYFNLIKNLNIIVYIICDDNYTWEEVIKEIPLLDKVTIKKRFILANGFNDVKNKVATILTKYKDWLKNPKDTVKKHNYIHYFSRDWNKTTQNEYLEKNVTDLKLNLIKGKTNDYEVKDSEKHLKIFYLDKNEVSTDNNYIDQLPTVRSIRESIKNPKWMNPFLINRDHFKSLMTKIKFPNRHDISIQAGGTTQQFSDIEKDPAAIRSAEIGAELDIDIREWLKNLYENSSENITIYTDDIDGSDTDITIQFMDDEDEYGLTDINSLFLHGYENLRIPNTINQLTELKEISIYNCGLTELPYNFSELTNLSTINLRKNNLTTYPRQLNELIRQDNEKKLEIALGDNNISNIPRDKFDDDNNYPIQEEEDFGEEY